MIKGFIIDVLMSAMLLAFVTADVRGSSVSVESEGAVEDVVDGQIICPPAIAQVSEWEILTQALIRVESRGDTLAVGKTRDLGALQITPIYVEDVNRILGEERYTLEDRKSLKKSVEMFNVLQGHYNSEQDIAKAIHLHNPKAGSWYAERVYAAMEEIRNEMLN